MSPEDPVPDEAEVDPEELEEPAPTQQDSPLIGGPTVSQPDQ